MITFLGNGSKVLPGIVITFLDGTRGMLGGGSRIIMVSGVLGSGAACRMIKGGAGGQLVCYILISDIFIELCLMDRVLIVNLPIVL